MDLFHHFRPFWGQADSIRFAACYTTNHIPAFLNFMHVSNGLSRHRLPTQGHCQVPSTPSPMHWSNVQFVLNIIYSIALYCNMMYGIVVYVWVCNVWYCIVCMASYCRYYCTVCISVQGVVVVVVALDAKLCSFSFS